MSERESTKPPATPLPGDLYADERYIVRDLRQIRALLRALIDQRSPLGVQPDGRGQSFPSAVLEVGDDTLLLDGSRQASVNRSVAGAGFLLCFALVDRVKVRFRVVRPRQQEHDGYVAFRAGLPDELYHLQRRELYRLATPLDDSPSCRVPDPAGGEPMSWRVADISAGGLALLLPADQQLFELDQRHAGCELELPGGPAITVTLVVRNLVTHRRADGIEQQRVGLRFEDLPRGADTAIQRHIFDIERRRNARLSGYG